LLLLSLFADMSVSLNFPVHERSFVCDVVNCHQKFISASAVARHIARAHQTHSNNSGKAEFWATYLQKRLGNLRGDRSICPFPRTVSCRLHL